MLNMRVILIPGMGCYPTAQSNWYSWFAKEMVKRSWECDLHNFPDPNGCKESIWIPFIRKDLGLDEKDPSKTVIVGHSSGAACAMRILEQEGQKENADDNKKLLGAILVATAYTDLGDPHEAASEYFNRPWDWESMKKGADNIVVFHGSDDHLIPVREARHIASKMGDCDNFQYIELDGVSHYFRPWQEILDVFDEKFGSIED